MEVDTALASAVATSAPFTEIVSDVEDLRNKISVEAQLVGWGPNACSSLKLCGSSDQNKKGSKTLPVTRK